MPDGQATPKLRRRWKTSASVVMLAIIALGVAIPAVERALDQSRLTRVANEHVDAGDRAIVGADYDLAAAAYARALEVIPNDPRLLALRARARAYQIADHPELLRSEEVAALRYDCQVGLASDSAHAAAYFAARAVVQIRLGDPSGAEASLDAALQQDPGFAPAHFAVAEQFVAAGKPEDARKHYEAALQRQANHVGSLLGLSALDLAKGELDPAIGRLKAALAQHENPSTRLSLVDALLQKGALDEALSEAQKGVIRDPQAAESHRSLGRVYGLLQRLPEAEKELRAALSVRPTAQGYLDLASVLGQEKRHKEALQTFKRALREEPTNPVALFGAGMAAENAGLPEEAKDFLEKVLALPRGGENDETVASLKTMAQKRLEQLNLAAPAGTKPLEPRPGR